MFTDAGLNITRLIQDNLAMKFTNGSAFLNHHFIKLGWLSSWLEIFPEQERENIFVALENNLNKHATNSDGLNLNVPIAFIEGIKSVA